MDTALAALADKLRGLAILDGPNTTAEAALEYAEKFGAKRAFMVDPCVQHWDTTASATLDAPASAWVAGLFAWTGNEYGFWGSQSNKEFVGITDTSRSIEFLDGDETCRANLLNNANIDTILRELGGDQYLSKYDTGALGKRLGPPRCGRRRPKIPRQVADPGRRPGQLRSL